MHWRKEQIEEERGKEQDEVEEEEIRRERKEVYTQTSQPIVF